MLEGSVTVNVSHVKEKTCRIPQIYENPVPQERSGSRIK